MPNYFNLLICITSTNKQLETNNTYISNPIRIEDTMYGIGAPNTKRLLCFSLSLVMRLASNYNNKNRKCMCKILEFIKQALLMQKNSLNPIHRRMLFEMSNKIQTTQETKLK